MGKEKTDKPVYKVVIRKEINIPSEYDVSTFCDTVSDSEKGLNIKTLTVPVFETTDHTLAMDMVFSLNAANNCFDYYIQYT